VAFKQSTGGLEVRLTVGLGGGDTRERFVQDADDALLFGEWRYWTGKSVNIAILM
jgi:hypothetical protein